MRLKQLYAGSDAISALLQHCFAGSSLEALFLNINNLTSTIPSSIPADSQLQALALGDNALTGDCIDLRPSGATCHCRPPRLVLSVMQHLSVQPRAYLTLQEAYQPRWEMQRASIHCHLRTTSSQGQYLQLWHQSLSYSHYDCTTTASAGQQIPIHHMQVRLVFVALHSSAWSTAMRALEGLAAADYTMAQIPAV